MKINYIIPFALLLSTYNANASTCVGSSISNGGDCSLGGTTWSSLDSYQNNIYSDIDKYGAVVKSGDSITFSSLIDLDKNAVDPSIRYNSFSDLNPYITSTNGSNISIITNNMMILDFEPASTNASTSTSIPIDPEDLSKGYVSLPYSYMDLNKVAKRNLTAFDSGFTVFKSANNFYNKAYKTLKFIDVSNGIATIANVVHDYGNVALRENTTLFNVSGNQGDKSDLVFDKNTHVNIAATTQATKGEYAGFKVANVYSEALATFENNQRQAMLSCMSSSTSSASAGQCKSNYDYAMAAAIIDPIYKIDTPFSINSVKLDGSQALNTLDTGAHFIVKATGENASVLMDGKLTGTSNSSNGMIYLDDSAVLNISKNGVVQSAAGTTIDANNNSIINNDGLIVSGSMGGVTYIYTNENKSLNGAATNVTIDSGSAFINNESGVYIGGTYTSKDSGYNFIDPSSLNHNSIVASSNDSDNKSLVINKGSMYFGGEGSDKTQKQTISDVEYKENLMYTRPITGVLAAGNSYISNDGYMALGVTLGDFSDSIKELDDRKQNHHYSYVQAGSSVISNKSNYVDDNSDALEIKPTSKQNNTIINNGVIEIGRFVEDGMGININNITNSLYSTTKSTMLIGGKNNIGYNIANDAYAELAGNYVFDGANNNTGVKVTNSTVDIKDISIDVNRNPNDSGMSDIYIDAQQANVNLNDNIYVKDRVFSDSRLNGIVLTDSSLNFIQDILYQINDVSVSNAIILKKDSSINTINGSLNLVMTGANSAYKGIIFDTTYSNIDSIAEIANAIIDITANNSIGVEDNSNASNFVIKNNTIINVEGKDKSIAVNIGLNNKDKTIVNDGFVISNEFAIKTDETSSHNTNVTNNSYLSGIVEVLSGSNNVFNLNKDSHGDQFIIGGLNSGVINLIGANSNSFNSLGVDHDTSRIVNSNLVVNLSDGANIIINNGDKKITGFDDVNVKDGSSLTLYETANQFQNKTAKNKLTNINIENTGEFNWVNINTNAIALENKDYLTGDGTVNLINSNIIAGESVKDFHGDINVLNSSTLGLSDFYNDYNSSNFNYLDIKNLNIHETARLKITNPGASYIKGIVNNKGNIDISSLDKNQILNITGVYNGIQNGILTVNTLWNDYNSSVTDSLIINGTATGLTKVEMLNPIIGNVTRGEDVKYSVPVITVTNHSVNDYAFFGFADTTGAAQATLVKKDANNYAWFLDKLGSGPVKPELPGFIRMPTANMEVGYSIIGTLHERVSEQQTIAWDTCKQCQATNHNGQWWGKFIGSSDKIKGAERYGYKSTLFGVQFGYDFDVDFDTTDESSQHSGLMLTYVKDDLKFNDKKSVQFDKGEYSVTDIRTGTGSSDTFAIGGYTTFYDKDGNYLDLVANIDHTKNKYESNRQSTSSNKSLGVTLSAEAGIPYVISENIKNNDSWLIEPQAQIIYQYRKFSDFKTKDNIEISQGNRQGLRARIGARLEYNTQSPELKTNSFYMVANLNQDLIGNNEGLTFGVENIKEKTPSTFGDIGVGTQLPLNDSSYIYIDTRYRKSLDNSNGDTDGIRGNIGFKYQF